MLQAVARSTDFYDQAPPWLGNGAASASSPQGQHLHKMRWPGEWDSLAFPTSEADAQKFIAECRRNHAQMVSHLMAAVKQRPMRAAKGLQRSFLQSDTAKVAGASYAERKRWRNLSPEARAYNKLHGLRPTGLQIVGTAREIDMWMYSGEPVHLKPQAKGNGEVRPTFAYGRREYGRQLVAVAAATPFLRLSPRQFQLQGGVDALWEWLRLNLPNAARVITTDVPACFCVIDRDHVNDDGLLPSAVMRSVLFDPLASVKGESWKSVPGKNGPIYLEGVSSGYSLQEALNGPGGGQARGIPPGAALSSLVAEARLRHILDAVEAVAEGVLVATIADNIIILVPDATLVAALKNALHQAVLVECGEAAADILQGRTEIIDPKKAEFAFLKCRVSIEQGVMKRRMTPGKYDEFRNRLAIEWHEKKLSDDRVLAKIKGWQAAHSYDPEAATAAIEALIFHGLTA